MFESVSGIIICEDLSEKLLKNDSNWKEPRKAIVVPARSRVTLN